MSRDIPASAWEPYSYSCTNCNQTVEKQRIQKDGDRLGCEVHFGYGNIESLDLELNLVKKHFSI